MKFKIWANGCPANNKGCEHLHYGKCCMRKPDIDVYDGKIVCSDYMRSLEWIRNNPPQPKCVVPEPKYTIPTPEKASDKAAHSHVIGPYLKIDEDAITDYISALGDVKVAAFKLNEALNQLNKTKAKCSFVSAANNDAAARHEEEHMIGNAGYTPTEPEWHAKLDEVNYWLHKIFEKEKVAAQNGENICAELTNVPAISLNELIGDDLDRAKEFLLLRGLQWRGAANIDSILRYDKDGETILVDKLGLMRLIMIANSRQKPRDIKLVDRDHAE